MIPENIPPLPMEAPYISLNPLTPNSDQYVISPCIAILENIQNDHQSLNALIIEHTLSTYDTSGVQWREYSH